MAAPKTQTCLFCDHEPFPVYAQPLCSYHAIRNVSTGRKCDVKSHCKGDEADIVTILVGRNRRACPACVRASDARLADAKAQAKNEEPKAQAKNEEPEHSPNNTLKMLKEQSDQFAKQAKEQAAKKKAEEAEKLERERDAAFHDCPWCRHARTTHEACGGCARDVKLHGICFFCENIGKEAGSLVRVFTDGDDNNWCLDCRTLVEYDTKGECAKCRCTAQICYPRQFGGGLCAKCYRVRLSRQLLGAAKEESERLGLGQQGEFENTKEVKATPTCAECKGELGPDCLGITGITEQQFYPAPPKDYKPTVIPITPSYLCRKCLNKPGGKEEEPKEKDEEMEPEVRNPIHKRKRAVAPSVLTEERRQVRIKAGPPELFLEISKKAEGAKAAILYVQTKEGGAMRFDRFCESMGRKEIMNLIDAHDLWEEDDGMDGDIDVIRKRVGGKITSDMSEATGEDFMALTDVRLSGNWEPNNGELYGSWAEALTANIRDPKEVAAVAAEDEKVADAKIIYGEWKADHGEE